MDVKDTIKDSNSVKIDDNSSGIIIKGHIGRWHVIDSCEIDGEKLYLLEHNTYGDEAAGVIVDSSAVVKLDDYREHLDIL